MSFVFFQAVSFFSSFQGLFVDVDTIIIRYPQITLTLVRKKLEPPHSLVYTLIVFQR